MSKILLIIASVWPEPKSSAAGSRMMQLIHYFRSQDFEITFASPCVESEKAFDLSSLGVVKVAIELNNSSFDTFIKKLNPHITLFDRFMIEEQFGWRVAEHCPDALRILDTEDLHGLRKGREEALKKGRPFDKTFLFNDTSKREIASIYRCDLSLIISEAEMEVLEHDFKVNKTLLCYLPFILDSILGEDIEKLPNFEMRENFVTIGNFLHPPNHDSVLYLKETIWPRIRQQLPNAELHVYGAYATQKVLQLSYKREGFFIKGFAENSNLVMQNARICLSPLRFGAGLKGKLLDAMQNGTPCVMSSIAAEGMFGTMEPNGYMEDDPEEFVQKAVELYSIEVLWKEKQRFGFEVINKRFQKELFYKKLHETITETLENLEKKRLDNFTGRLLMHHTLQSTKFMAKWIEEKNKKPKQS